MAAHDRLLQFRKERGFSQEKLASLLNCGQAHVGLVERGLRNPGPDFIHLLEDLTRDWERGPIRTPEWLSKEARERLAVAHAPKRRRAS